MHKLSLRELSRALKQRKLSSVELTQHCLERAKQYQLLNSFISIDEERALVKAAEADKLLQKGTTKLLTGIPMAHKDIFCTDYLATTCGSKMLANFRSPYQATVVEKIREAGAIMLGKTNMDEFAMGSTNETSYFGAVKNPWDLNHVPGGSSGGSAAAVAAQLVPFTTASDTGGSIRQPAAFCGVSGLKPTYGLISRYGMVAFASSLDQAGPIANSAEDLALILQSMAGFDNKDSTSLQTTIPDYLTSLNDSIKGLRIGLLSSSFLSGVDSSIQQAITHAAEIFKQAGAEIIDLELSLQSLWVPCYYVIASAEASSNLARYDGLRFGHRSTKGNTVTEVITNSRSEGFGIEVKRRILTGTHVLSTGYFDAYYLQALKVRRLIQNDFHEKFAKVDVIMSPTTPTCAFQLGNIERDPIQNYLADKFTVAANLAGIPALSIPVGFSKGLPIGMQLMGNHFSEAKLLTLSHYYQQCTDWHQAKPTIKE